MKNLHPNAQSGFTLVELAVVMIIIGLLVGGVLKGQQLIENAKVTRTIKDVNGYIAAHHGFYDKYRAFAGDMGNATARLNGCTGANFCADGNGDSRVGVRLTSFGAFTGANHAENTQHWKHLALSDFISGVNAGAPSADGLEVFGESHPSAKIGGGFSALHMASANTEYSPGHTFLLSANPNDAGAFFPPSIAFQIDQKMDDGNPNAGSVYSEGTSSNCDENTNNTYLPDSMGGVCLIMFQAR